MNKKQVNQRELETLIKKVENEVSYNCHSEALKMIADFVGYHEYSEYFLGFVVKESMTLEESRERHEASERMLFLIGFEYGA